MLIGVLPTTRRGSRNESSPLRGKRSGIPAHLTFLTVKSRGKAPQSQEAAMNSSRIFTNTLRKWIVCLFLLMVPALVWAQTTDEDKKKKTKTTPPAAKSASKPAATRPPAKTAQQPQKQQPRVQQQAPQPRVQQQAPQPRVQQPTREARVKPQRQEANQRRQEQQQLKLQQSQARDQRKEQQQQAKLQQRQEKERLKQEKQQLKLQQRQEKDRLKLEKRQAREQKHGKGQQKEVRQRQQGRPEPMQQARHQRQEQPRALTPAESRQQIQDLNRNRAALRGINRRPLPAGEVKVHSDGRRIIAAPGGRQLDVRRDGTVERVSFRDGRTATFRPDGRVRSYHANGMQVNHWRRGGRTIVTERPDRTVLVSTGRNRGYVQRTVVVRNRTYVQRTYVVNNVTYVRVYRTYYYGGGTYYRYEPVYRYHPVFYGWAYEPWPGPVRYRWGWYNDPWYGYYGPYFAPYPVYPSASLWLTDFLLSETLRLAYQAHEEAAANEAAEQERYESSAGPSPAGGSAYATQLTPEVKQAIAEEVRQQLDAERAAAANAPPGGQPTAVATAPPGAEPVAGANTQQLAASPSEVPPALNPAHRVFVVSNNFDVDDGGQGCSLSPGDVITRLTDTPDENQNVKASVLSSQKADCAAGSTVAVSVEDLQEMHNHFHEQIDSGLKQLAENQGQGGLPAAPDTRTSFTEVPAPQPDQNVVADLQSEQQQADQTEAQVQEEAFIQM